MRTDNPNLRANVPAPEGLTPSPGGLLPAGQDHIPPAFTEDTHQHLDAIGQLLVDIELAVQSNSIDKLHAVENECSKIGATLLGRIGVGIDKVEEACSKIGKKLHSTMAQTAGSMYEYLGAANIPFPSMADVSAGIDTTPRPAVEIATGTTSQDTPPSISPDFVPRAEPTPIPPSGHITNLPDFYPCRDSTIPPPSMPWEHLGGFVSPPAGGSPFPVPPCAGTQPPPGSFPRDCYGRIDNFPWYALYLNEFFDQNELKPASVPPGSVSFALDCTHLTGGATYTYWHGVASLTFGFPMLGGHPTEVWFYIRTGYIPNIVQDLPGVLFWLCGVEPRYDNGTSHCFSIVRTGVTSAECKPTIPSTQPPTPVPIAKPPVCNVCGVDPCKCVKQCVAPNEEPKPDQKPPEPAQVQPPPAIKGDDVCKAIADSIDHLLDEQCDVKAWTEFLGIVVNGISPAAIFLRLIFSGADGVLRQLTQKFAEWLCKTVNNASKGLDCDRAKLLQVQPILSALFFINKWTGIIPEQIINQLQIISRTICQSRLPDGGMADVAWLRGTITDSDWECFHKAAGNHLGPAKLIRDAGRAKPDPAQLDKLYRRKLITQVEYDKLTREAGVINDDDKKHIHDLNEQFPTHSEIISLLIRDVFDEVNIDWTESDKIFRQKFVGKARDWFEANGISEELAKSFWRGHWHLPSWTTGKEMLWRLRPGEQNVEKPFTKDDLKQLLLQDDWAPQYIDQMIATSYHVPTRRDLIMGFMVRSLSDDDFKKGLQDQGYKPEGTETLLKLYKVKRNNQEYKDAGYPTIRELSQDFAKCELSDDEFIDAIAPLIVDEEQLKNSIEASKKARLLWTRKQGIAAIKRPYILGVLSDDDARRELSAIGIDGTCQDSLLDQWRLLAMRKNKMLTAGTLCRMLERAIVTPAQFVVALIKSGWTRDDAERMLDNCKEEIHEKQIRRAEALARRQMAEARRAAREAEKLLRLQKCGPPECPTNTPGGQHRRRGDRSIQGQAINGTAPTDQPAK